MAVSFRYNQHGDSTSSDNVTLPVAPVQNNLLLDVCWHFTNGTSCAGDAYTSFLELFGTNSDVGAGTKYAGAAESSTQTPGSVGLERDHHLAEFSGVTGTIGTDVPAHHEGVDKTVTSEAFTTVSFNTAAANTGIYGIVGIAGAVGTAFTGGLLTGGNSPTVLSTWIVTTGGGRNRVMAVIYDYFPISGSAVAYTFKKSGGAATFTGFYALLSIANATSLFIPPGQLKNPNRGKGKGKTGNSLILDPFTRSILKVPNRQKPPFRQKLSQFNTMGSASITDALTATDAFTAVLNSSGSIVETANAVDNFTALTSFAGSISESANAVDTVSAAVTLGASVAESAQASDVYSAKLGTVPAFQVTEGWSHPLNTTLLNFFSYDPKTELLMVNFTDGTERTYSGVPFGVANQFWATSNPDLFYNTTIKDSYPRVYA